MLLKILMWLLIAALGALLVANIPPYIEATNLVFSVAGSTGKSICQQLGMFPFAGGVMAWGCEIVSKVLISMGGFLVWAIFQVVELLPIVTYFNVPFLTGLVSRLQTAPQASIDASDRDSVIRAKKRLNSVIERSLSFLLTFSWVMYLVDLALMCWLYSPINKLGNLQPLALGRVLVGVFGVEVCILIISALSNVLDQNSIQNPTAQQRPTRQI